MATPRVFANIANLPAGGGRYIAHVLEDGNLYCYRNSAWYVVGGSGEGGPVDWADVQNKPATFAPSAHNHDDRYYTDGETDTLLAGKAASNHNHDGTYATAGHNHAGVYEPADAAIQTHITSAHAPSNAQKNSDITKAEIEAKLTGELTSHSHAVPKLDDLAAPDDNTDLDVSTLKHGLFPKLPGGTSYYRADGTWGTPTAALPALVTTALDTEGADQTVVAGYGAYVPHTYEIEATRTLEIAAGAIMEVG